MMKKLLSLLVAAALLLSLAACGKKEEEAPTPEFGYKADYTALSTDGSTVNPLVYTDEGYYAQIYQNVETVSQPRAAVSGAVSTESEDAAPTEGDNAAPTEGDDAAPTEGDNAAPTEGDNAAPAEGDNTSPTEGDDAASTEGDDAAPTESDGAAPLAGNNAAPAPELWFISYSGERRKLENYQQIQAGDIDPEGKRDLSVGSNLECLVLGPDGNLLSIEDVYASYSTAPETVERNSDEYYNQYVFDEELYIRVLDPENGGEISKAPIKKGEDEYYSAYRAAGDGQGNILIPNNDGLIAIAPDGSTAYTVKTDDYPQDIIRLGDGRLGVTWYGSEGFELHIVDPSTGSLGETAKLPQQAYDLISGNSEYDLYYTSGLYLYGYDLDTEEATQILNWMDSDINGENLDNVIVRSDGTITGVMNYWGQNNRSSELVMLTKVPYESLPVKEHLTMAIMYYDGYSLGPAVIDFNRSHDDCRIDIVDYSQYDTEEDYSAGQTKLTTEVISGKVPDILSLSGLSYTQLASKGLLEDLYPYLDADATVTREDLIPNVLKAMEYDGKLYQLCGSFSIQTVAAAKSVVGDRKGWTYDDMYAALATMPEGCDLFNIYSTKDSMLRDLLMMDLDSYVDWANGQCSFDSENFIQLLEFANRFRTQEEVEKLDTTDSNAEARISAGQQLLYNVYVYDFQSMQYPGFVFGGDENVALIGYPTTDGSYGSAISLSSSFAIGKDCKNKQAAWEFLRDFLISNEGGRDPWGNLPVNRNAYNAQLKEAMTPNYELDENGQPRLDENGEPIKYSSGGIGWGDGVMHEIWETTQEQADLLQWLIDNTTKVYSGNYDDKIIEIVQDNAKYYFNGQQDAQTTAKNIQSAAVRYVNEQR